MVVLDSKLSPPITEMFGGTGRDQYIQPDYLAPLSTTVCVSKFYLNLQSLSERRLFFRRYLLD